MSQEILKERRQTMIENRNLTTGTHLIAHYRKKSHTCEVTGKEGKPSYKFEDGREFKSLSAAGTAITGGACNGWAFWSLETAQDAKPAEIHEQASATTETAAPQEIEETANVEVKAEEVQKMGTYRMKNQKGSSEGMVRWFCYDCAEPFLAPKSEKHAACPKEHKK